MSRRSLQLVVLLLWMVMLATSPVATAQELGNVEADQIGIRSVQVLDRQQTGTFWPISLSADDKKLFYVKRDAKGVFLIIRDIRSGLVLRRTKLPSPAQAVAPSPDGTKVIYSFRGTTADGNTHALLDLATNTTKRFRPGAGIQKLVWLSGNRLVSLTYAKAFARQDTKTCSVTDLDTFQSHDLDASLSYLWDPQRASRHRWAYMTLADHPLLSLGNELVISDRYDTFSRHLTTIGYDDSLVVAQDLSFAIIGRYHGSRGENTLELMRLGIITKPLVHFAADWAADVSPKTKEMIAAYFNRGFRIWASVHRAMKNPLNQRTIGADTSVLKAKVQLELARNTFVVARTTFEATPIEPGDVLSDFSSDVDSSGDKLSLGREAGWAVVRPPSPLQQENLAPAHAASDTPAAPQGSVVFVRDLALWAMAADGSNARELPLPPGSSSWSLAPDAAIVFDRRLSGDSNLYLIPDLRRPQPQALTDDGRSIQPLISPDGKHVAFKRTRLAGTTPPSKIDGLYVMDLATKTSLQLVGVLPVPQLLQQQRVRWHMPLAEFAEPDRLRWSPDGTRLLFGRGIQFWAETAQLAPQALPDRIGGNLLDFSGDWVIWDTDATDYNLRLFDLDDGRDMILVDHIFVGEAKISPDGTLVAFSTPSDSLGEEGLWLVSSRGGRKTKLAAGPASSLLWSGDSKTLFFERSTGGQQPTSEIWSTGLGKPRPTRLAVNGQPIAWLPVALAQPATPPPTSQ